MLTCWLEQNGEGKIIASKITEGGVIFSINMKPTVRCSVIVLVVLFLSPLAASASIPSIKNADVENIRQRIYDGWAPTHKIPSGKQVIVGCDVAADGKFYNVKLQQSCGDPQVDADCVQAVLGASAFCSMRHLTWEGELCPVPIYFDCKTKAGHTNSGIARYFASHPGKESTDIAYYRFPLDVLKRYPGLFTENELLDDSNIRVCRFSSGTTTGPDNGPGLSNSTVRDLRWVYQNLWIPFFLKFPSANKQQFFNHWDNPADEPEQAGAR